MTSKTQTKRFEYSEGATLSGITFWLGLILMGISAYFLWSSNNFAFQILVGLGLGIGLVSLLSIKGVLLDFEHKKGHFFFNFLVVKLPYQRIDLSKAEKISLVLFTENQSMHVQSISTTVRTRVYELYLHFNSEPKLLIAESTDHNEALEMMAQIALGLNIPSEDKYAQWRQHAKELRQKRKVLGRDSKR